ncbi:tRNA (5-methylaminomethyl-2-thiouridylate)-methyltransferase [Desulfurobacterium pacificum]|uniref:tRNA-uridine 2-sulfurtransferase n=1 Tax=Desulfurobacterium pacificum TaxID=240166 RepID=A0ABY1NIL2_9BACT|nr:tRNA 2-thiouridine(34) synthase MnmA [Desulfurobacterium pacificum]SMP10784.1 tRNA (5-methylaminomethyl-2-thiouridylate)-methyltransferase [Desulfurobacterium pacificum]
MKEKVIVGFSGGIDSFFASLILKEQGFNVLPVYFKLFPDADVDKVRKKASLLNLSLTVLDLSKEFREVVIERFIDYYKKGLTPNPCVLCNREIKIKYLELIRKEVKASYIATGHYAKIEYFSQWNRKLIKRGKDRKKEQSYFLSMVRSEDLKYLLLPLGDFKKEEVSQLIKDLGYEWEEKESQDVCFIKSDYREFLKRFIPPLPGKFVLQSGEVLGSYEYPYSYTVGQRKGLNIPYKYPLYVIKVLPYQRKIVVGKKEMLYKEEVFVKDVEWHLLPDLVPNQEEISVQIRYRAKPVNIGKIEYLKNGIYCVKLRPKVEAPAPGQVCAFYYNNLLMGGGEIIEPQGVGR